MRGVVTLPCVFAHALSPKVLTNAADRPGGVVARQSDPGTLADGPDRIAAVDVRHGLAKPRGILLTRLQPKSLGGCGR